MAVNKGASKKSVRYYFFAEDDAWKFAQEMVVCGITVIDYGYDSNNNSSKNNYYIDVVFEPEQISPAGRTGYGQ